MDFHEEVYALVRLIPPGKVLTYGRVAQLLERPRGARMVGWALRQLPTELANGDVPWHRVINSQRQVSPRGDNEGEQNQRDLLIMEGVVFDKSNRVSPNAIWQPSIWEIRDLLGK